MAQILRKYSKSIGLFLLLGCLLPASGCFLWEKSCEELDKELRGLYNDYLDKIRTLSDEQIIEKCRQVQKKCPDNAIAYELEGLIHWENDRPDEAMPHYLQALERNPNDADLLIDAQILAYATKNLYLFVDEAKKIKTKPFQKITLKEYAASPEENRGHWCEKSLKARVDPSSTQNLVGRQGTILGTRTMSVTFHINAAEELDSALLRQAEQEPDAVLSKITSKKLFEGSVSLDAQIDPEALRSKNR